MPTQYAAYDSAEFLKSDEEIAAYLDEACADGDPAVIAHALGVAARARGMTRLARETGLQREGLYRSLSTNGNPELSTFLRVLKVLGMRIMIKPSAAKPKKRRKPA
jgi:probable addiction module antidote protein